MSSASTAGPITEVKRETAPEKKKRKKKKKKMQAPPTHAFLSLTNHHLPSAGVLACLDGYMNIALENTEV